MPGSAASQTLAKQLVGTWIVTSWEQVMKDGKKFQRFGTDPKGYNVFDANGRFFLMFARPDIPKIASSNPNTPTPEEARAIALGIIAYYGTYTVDEGAKGITMNIESSSFANQVGAVQKRTVSAISASELKYENTTVLTGGQIYVAFKKAN